MLIRNRKLFEKNLYFPTVYQAAMIYPKLLNVLKEHQILWFPGKICFVFYVMSVSAIFFVFTENKICHDIWSSTDVNWCFITGIYVFPGFWVTV